MNRKRRSKRHHEINPPRGFTGALQSERIEILSETNRRRFQVSAAVAERRFAMNSKMFKIGLRVRHANDKFDIPRGGLCRAIRSGGGYQNPQERATHRCFESARHSLYPHFPV